MCSATGSLYIEYGKSYGFLIQEHSILNSTEKYIGEMGFGPLTGHCYRVSDGWITFGSMGRIWILNVSTKYAEINMVRGKSGYLTHRDTGNEILAARADMNELKLKSLFL
jgi:hypothetical protein